MTSTDNMTPDKVYSVSGLTAAIKSLLEKNFPIVWLEGEISNFRVPGSGHYYFTLKDDRAAISAVMFTGQHRRLKFVPEDGMSVTGLGRISLYEPRGSYQIIFEHLMPKGAGELLIAFEQLKKKLEKEGLFDPKHKKPIPFLPETIGIISSVAGAAVHDIINVVTRRFPGVHIQIIPVSVQGKNAAPEIANAVALANLRAEARVLVIARGGGSLEDLMPFNSETVARAVFESRIPVVSAVGHETDFTICDFVADLRAPTPSAAAELIVPVREELQSVCEGLRRRLTRGTVEIINKKRLVLASVSRRLADPRRHIQDIRLRLDDLTLRLERILKIKMENEKTRLHWLSGRLAAGQPNKMTRAYRQTVDRIIIRLRDQMMGRIKEKYYLLKGVSEKLYALDPRAVLNRGYSITRTVPGGIIVRDSAQVDAGENLEILVAKGVINCEVK